MKPLGQKPSRFPSKTDCHPKDGEVNWWEFELGTYENKAAYRQQELKEVDEGLEEYFYEKENK